MKQKIDPSDKARRADKSQKNADPSAGESKADGRKPEKQQIIPSGKARREERTKARKSADQPARKNEAGGKSFSKVGSQPTFFMLLFAIL